MKRTSRPQVPGPGRWPDRLDHAALILVMGVVCARAVIAERAEAEELAVVSRLQGTHSGSEGPGPVTSLICDGLIFGAATLCAVAGAMRGQWRRRPAGVEWAVAALILVAFASLTVAGNKRLALNTTMDRLASVLVLIVVAHTVHRWWQVRSVLTTVGACGVAFAVFCITQLREMEDTRRWLVQHRQEAVASGRVAADDTMVELLERRVNAGEANGFFSHPNIAGAYLMAAALATAGLGVARCRARTRVFRTLFGAVTIAAAGVITVGMGLTHGRGAISSAAIAAAGWSAISHVWRRGDRLRRYAYTHRLKLLAGGWALVALAAVGVIAYGMRHGGLPTGSLWFRWQYWTGAAHMVARHPWLGVGAGNFDRHYVRYKRIDAPEEVKDPHNVFVTAAAEWGIPGLIATVALMVAVSAALCAAPGEDHEPRNKGPRAPDQRGAPIGVWILLMLAAFVLARITAVPEELWLIWVLIPAVIWTIAAFALAVDSDQVSRFEDDPLLVMSGLVAALIAIFLDNTISFSLVYPGSSCTFFAIAGLAIAVRRLRAPSLAPGQGAAVEPEARGPFSRGPAVVAGLLMIGQIVYWPVLVAPVWKATQWLAKARRADTTSESLTCYRRAAESDPLDPVAAEELAERILRGTERGVPLDDKALSDALESIQEAIRRDPEDNRHYRTLASVYSARHALRGDPNDAARAAAASAKAVALYPGLPSLRFEYGELLAAQATARRDATLLTRALDEMRRALRFDDSRPPSELRRFTPEQRGRIEARIRSLQGGAAETQSGLTTRATSSSRPSESK